MPYPTLVSATPARRVYHYVQSDTRDSLSWTPYQKQAIKAQLRRLIDQLAQEVKQ